MELDSFVLAQLDDVVGRDEELGAVEVDDLALVLLPGRKNRLEAQVVGHRPFRIQRAVAQVGRDAVLHRVGLRLPLADLTGPEYLVWNACRSVVARDAALVVRRMGRRIERRAWLARVAPADADVRRWCPAGAREEVLPDGCTAGPYGRAVGEVRGARRVRLCLERAQHDVVGIDLGVVVTRHPMDAWIRAALVFVVVREA